MKTFTDLYKEVVEPGFCHHCGGCVTFCTAINYGALTVSEDGSPMYKDKDSCIECGLCYMICPEIGELDEEVKELTAWSAPVGRVLQTVMARSVDPAVRAKATDGGVVTALLLHLLELGRIDGAIVTRQVAPFKREPWLALTKEEIIEAAGFHFDASHGISHFSDTYSTYSPSIHELAPMAKQGLHRVAFVGTPCQIKAIRKMEALGIVPSDSIKYLFGLFCSGNYVFGPEERKKLEELGGFKWEDIKKVNVKEQLMIHLKSGEIKYIPLDRLDFMKRYACKFCDDYSAEFADLSFGGIGAEEGWTTVIIRSKVGRTAFSEAMEDALEISDLRDASQYTSEALKKIIEWSEKKRQMARENHEKLVKKGSQGK